MPVGANPGSYGMNTIRGSSYILIKIEFLYVDFKRFVFNECLDRDRMCDLLGEERLCFTAYLLLFLLF